MIIFKCQIIKCTYLFIHRWSHVWKTHFIQEVLKWQMANDERCLILNFGYKQALPYSELMLSLESTTSHLSVSTLVLNSPIKCSVVVIGVDILKQVVLTTRNTAIRTTLILAGLHNIYFTSMFCY